MKVLALLQNLTKIFPRYLLMIIYKSLQSFVKPHLDYRDIIYVNLTMSAY